SDELVLEPTLSSNDCPSVKTPKIRKMKKNRSKSRTPKKVLTIREMEQFVKCRIPKRFRRKKVMWTTAEKKLMRGIFAEYLKLNNCTKLPSIKLCKKVGDVNKDKLVGNHSCDKIIYAW